MKNILIITFLSAIILSCGTAVDTSEWSGVTSQSDERTMIVDKLAKGYVAGNFGIASEYFSDDAVHMVNNDVYTNEEIIAGYNFHSLLYDEIQHIDPVLTTVEYNNGEVYTNHWSDWSGVSKITGEQQKNTFHCWWQWEGEKIIGTQCYFDTSDIEAEAALYQEQNSSN
tara:strand:+ start:268 stop:774 length:507 start_codon:yes stop_codon:yes gene_type:complete